MSGCGLDAGGNRPLLKVQLQGRGEDAMRMDKRLRCAGRALGVRVEVDWDATQYGDSVVKIGDQVVVDRLVDTAELEALLRPLVKRMAAGPEHETAFTSQAGPESDLSG